MTQVNFQRPLRALQTNTTTPKESVQSTAQRAHNTQRIHCALFALTTLHRAHKNSDTNSTSGRRYRQLTLSKI